MQRVSISRRSIYVMPDVVNMGANPRALPIVGQLAIQSGPASLSNSQIARRSAGEKVFE
jgi:hypothetical protein